MTEGPLVFVHIPKTAGTSIRHALEQQYAPEAMAFDYGPDEEKTSPLVKRHMYEEPDLDRFGDEVRKQGIKLISGHFPASRYLSLCGVQNILVFLRDPIQRLVSEFLHFRRYHGYTKGIEVFGHDSTFINRQMGCLEGVSLAEVGFLGITEQYDVSLDMANRQFGWNLPCFVLNTARPSIGVDYTLEGDQVQELLDLNRRDIDFYQQAVAEFQRRCAGRAAGA